MFKPNDTKYQKKCLQLLLQELFNQICETKEVIQPIKTRISDLIANFEPLPID